MPWRLAEFVFGVCALIALPLGAVATANTHANSVQWQTSRPQANFDQTELNCLSKNIYFEARGETPEGQLAVAYVTLNRTRSPEFPGTICDVVYQKDAFSWTRNASTRHASIHDEYAWQLATLVAKLVMSGLAEDPTGGAVDYCAAQVKPYWRFDKTFSIEIGHHKFYKRQSSPEGLS